MSSKRGTPLFCLQRSIIIDILKGPTNLALRCLSIKEALELDKMNGNTLWAVAIAKAMKDVCVANILLGRQCAPIGYQKIPCHITVDVKMEDFRHKAWLIASSIRPTPLPLSPMRALSLMRLFVWPC
jgi:hypothetical protein